MLPQALRPNRPVRNSWDARCIPAAGGTYWVGEAMGGVDYNEAGPKPDTTGKATKTLAANAAHPAHLLSADPYPAS
ncbi:hypothetical protein GCM10009558_084220 [Virgisporangium aurantiacum]